MRDRIYELVEASGDDNKIRGAYDVVMIIAIIASLLPVAMKSSTGIFGIIDKATTVLFIIDYGLRLITADKRFKKGVKSFFIYPVTPMAIIDLLAILPSIIHLNGALRTLKILRLLRTLRVFRVFKAFRYSTSASVIISVFKRQKDSLLGVLGLAVGYILISALIVIGVEPETFPTFFDAVYWATVSLTTVGYGDIYPVSAVGRVITMISSFFGIAIVALPAGIITAGFMSELNKRKEEDKSEKKPEDIENEKVEEKSKPKEGTEETE